MKVDVRLNAIVDPERANGRSLSELTRLVVAGGATLIQLRDKHGATRQMIEEARAIKAALAGTGVRLVINDHVAVALELSAEPPLRIFGAPPPAFGSLGKPPSTPAPCPWTSCSRRIVDRAATCISTVSV